MSLLRLINAQGIAGIAVSLALSLLLAMQMAQTRHWKSQSGRFELLYSEEKAALADTIADYRAAADTARAADAANLERVAAEQRSISERTSNDYEARLAAARTLAQRLRNQDARTTADPGAGRTASMPSLPAPPDRAAEAAHEDGLPDSERLVATEQAIQLDELIKWIRKQAALDPNEPQK